MVRLIRHSCYFWNPHQPHTGYLSMRQSRHQRIRPSLYCKSISSKQVLGVPKVDFFFAERSSIAVPVVSVSCCVSWSDIQVMVTKNLSMQLRLCMHCRDGAQRRHNNWLSPLIRGVKTGGGRYPCTDEAELDEEGNFRKKRDKVGKRGRVCMNRIFKEHT